MSSEAQSFTSELAELMAYTAESTPAANGCGALAGGMCSRK